MRRERKNAPQASPLEPTLTMGTFQRIPVLSFLPDSSDPVQYSFFIVPVPLLHFMKKN
jgi:hypothetical protein